MEALLVQKRYTYAFFDFVQGNYKISELLHLFNKMTMEEILLVMTRDFKRMWYHVWLRNEYEDNYGKKIAKFYKCTSEGNEMFSSALEKCKPVGQLVWNIPKGRRESAHESDILCAIREVEEETMLKKPMYNIISGAQRKHSFISDRVRYTNIYYAALLNMPAAADYSVDLPVREPHLMSENSAPKWCDITFIRSIDHEHCLENNIAPIFRVAKKYNTGKWRVPKVLPATDTEQSRADMCENWRARSPSNLCINIMDVIRAAPQQAAAP